jgi:uncharacterized cupredoxin-like copper-binding protein
MNWLGYARTSLAIGLAFSLLTGAFYGLGAVRVVSAHPVDDSAASVSISAVNNFAFSPSMFENLSLNESISVSFSNLDTSGASHTFTIIGREGWVIPKSYTPAQLTALAYGSTYPNKLNLESSTTGDTVTGNLTVTAPGWYEFVCTESGHFQSGMYGFIAFGMALPSNLTVSVPNTGPGAAVFIIIGTIVTLTVIALVLGFIFGRRRGSEFEMPPERLGYPEPRSAGPGGSVPPEHPPQS